MRHKRIIGTVEKFVNSTRQDSTSMNLMTEVIKCDLCDKFHGSTVIGYSLVIVNNETNFYTLYAVKIVFILLVSSNKVN